ncbi:MAG: riboflavin biosynthesis protein RibF, partial [Desulfobacterales bacterium]|nr:riboflavin biosynthesis protein RibF [Desulfobacterales bacterium]
DYTFGKNREGDISLLRSFGEQMQFEVIAVDKIQISDELPGRISSTKIRELVIEGNVDEAQKLLGRHYQIRGIVVPGRDRGGELVGYPTANVNLHDELCPKTGIYAVRVECEGEIHNGVANIGYSPTFADHTFTVEVHLFDFDKDIYGDCIRVEFVAYLRGEIKFAGPGELATQIKKDIIKAREILSS